MEPRTTLASTHCSAGKRRAVYGSAPRPDGRSTLALPIPGPGVACPDRPHPSYRPTPPEAILGLVVTGVLTAGLVVSLMLLIAALPAHKETPTALLVSAAALWATNILVFALWHWRLDAGGPHHRERRAGHPDGAFLFPQMTMDTAALHEAGQHNWSPNFVDYLFLAFNTSTTLSPTDVPILARWAKILMMLQALLSLLILALLAARAVNIL